jgi:hypothetical protein
VTVGVNIIVGVFVEIIVGCNVGAGEGVCSTIKLLLAQPVISVKKMKNKNMDIRVVFMISGNYILLFFVEFFNDLW